MIQKSSYGVFALFVVMFLGELCIFAAEAHITDFGSLNEVTGLSFKDGTLFVATRAGLWTYGGGVLRRFTEADGVPMDEMLQVEAIDGNRAYIGPVGPFEGPQRLYEATVEGDSLAIRDVTPEPPLEELYNTMRVDRNGVLWVVDKVGLRRFNGTVWDQFPSPTSWDGVIAHSSNICFDKAGRVWFSCVGCLAAVFDGASWHFNTGLIVPRVVEADRSGCLWAVDWTGVFKRCDAKWELVFAFEGDVDYNWKWVSGLAFDGQGNLWGTLPCEGELVVYDGENTTVIKGIEGFEFPYRTSYYSHPVFTPSTEVGDNTLVFGMWGYGLLILENGSLKRAFISDSPPGGMVIDLCQDAQGRVWARNGNGFNLGVYDAGSWEQIYIREWCPYYSAQLDYFPQIAAAQDGSVWMRSSSGARRFRNGEVTVFDESNSALSRGDHVAFDSRGTGWFTNASKEAAAVSFDGETWRRYSSTDYFHPLSPGIITIGPDDAKWFRRSGGGYAITSGYTVFDGSEWTQLDFGRELPADGRRMFFDLHGTAFLVASHGEGDNTEGFCLEQQGDQWVRVLDAHVHDMQCDSEGILWCAADEGVFSRRDGHWALEEWSGEVCAPEENIWLPQGSALRLLIDHDGNKWVGTYPGLTRVEDGGAAQQSIELNSREDGDDYVLSATLVNAGNPIALDAFLAVDLDGHLLYYPEWSGEPAPIRVVLPAYSTNTCDLLRLNRDTLGEGSYTFYACLSLTGDTSLMVGARDRKIVCVTVSNE